MPAAPPLRPMAEAAVFCEKHACIGQEIVLYWWRIIGKQGRILREPVAVSRFFATHPVLCRKRMAALSASLENVSEKVGWVVRSAGRPDPIRRFTER